MRDLGWPLTPGLHQVTAGSVRISNTRSRNFWCHHTLGAGLFARMWKLPRMT